MRLKWNRGHERLIYVLGADHHGYIARLKAIAGALGRDPGAGRDPHLPARPPDRGRRRRARCRSDGGTSSSSTSFSTRSASTRLAGTCFRVATSRRWTSTSTSRASAPRRTRSTTSSTRTPGSRASCETPRGGRPRRSPSGQVAPAERELVKRLAEFPAVVAEATERRGPHALPTYAIRVADDFHRFYHDHRVLESEEEPFRLALCKATASVIARALDLMGVEAPERM